MFWSYTASIDVLRIACVQCDGSSSRVGSDRRCWNGISIKTIQFTCRKEETIDIHSMANCASPRLLVEINGSAVSNGEGEKPEREDDAAREMKAILALVGRATSPAAYALSTIKIIQAVADCLR